MKRYQTEKPRSHKPVVLLEPQIDYDVARPIEAKTSIYVAAALA